MTPHIPEDGNEISNRIAGETARGTLMFRFSKPETPRAALLVFLRNETRAKSGFVSYVSISMCFDFDPNHFSRIFPHSSGVIFTVSHLRFIHRMRCRIGQPLLSNNKKLWRTHLENRDFGEKWILDLACTCCSPRRGASIEPLISRIH